MGKTLLGTLFDGNWTDYHNNGIIPNLWAGITGQKSNEIINQQNVDFQHENLDYQKALQEKIFEREDSSYQRTVNDMHLAGLSPLSMNGTNSAGDTIATTAPQKQLTGVDSISAMATIFDTISQMRANSANATLAEAQAEKAKAETTGLNSDNLFRDSNNLWENISRRAAAEDSMRNLAFNNLFGLSDNMPDWLKRSSLLHGDKPLQGGFYDVTNTGANWHFDPDYSFKTSTMEDITTQALLDVVQSIFGNLVPNIGINFSNNKGESNINSNSNVNSRHYSENHNYNYRGR